MANLMKPVININGTTRESLIEMRLQARHEIYRAMHALQKMRPHGRDYFNVEAYNKDLTIYQNRFAVLDILYSAGIAPWSGSGVGTVPQQNCGIMK